MNRIRADLKIDMVHKRGLTGKNIGIAVLDTGICSHVDFCKPYNRIIEFIDCVNGYDRPYDDNGHGSHVCGIIGGNGYAKNGLYAGVCPRCNIVAIKVLDKNGMGTVDNVIKAIKWIIEYKDLYNIRIVNLSVGTYGLRKKDVTELIKWVEMAWDSGLIVLTAAGNKGPKPMSITAPGISKKIITVGTSEGYVNFSTGKYRIKHYSGCGPTRECIVKPEVVAPGVNIISCSPTRGMYVSKSGTSMATPIVAGCIGLVLESCERGRRLTNKDIKIALLECSKDLGRDKNSQGWGKIDLIKMIEFFGRFSMT